MLRQNFFSHLQELRTRLIKCLLAYIASTVIAWNYLDPVIQFAVRPVGRLVFTAPEEAFNARMTLALAGGLILAMPVILYQIWRFIAIGLTAEERRYIRLFGPLSLGLFMLGVFFGYYVMLPASINFLLGFSSAWMVPMITVDKYISFVGSIVLASGITFEMPLVLAFLARLGIATPEFLRQKRRYAIILILIIAAILTPPDVVSQLILTAPLLLLYELGIILMDFSRKGGTVKLLEEKQLS